MEYYHWVSISAACSAVSGEIKAAAWTGMCRRAADPMELLLLGWTVVMWERWAWENPWLLSWQFRQLSHCTLAQGCLCIRWNGWKMISSSYCQEIPLCMAPCFFVDQEDVNWIYWTLLVMFKSWSVWLDSVGNETDGNFPLRGAWGSQTKGLLAGHPVHGFTGFCVS